MATSLAAVSGTGLAAVTLRTVGGPTAIVSMGGLNLLTDPTFDQPGDHPIGRRVLTKTVGPAIEPRDIGVIDVVLLSHDQHPDNLDDAGREVLRAAPLVLSTKAAAERLGGNTRELPLWRSHILIRPDGGELKVTGVPAQHGPVGTEHLTGEVRGFVLSGAGLPTVYISGDNASLSVVRDIADHAGPIDIALIFAGRARTSLLDAYLTFGADQAAEAAAILGCPVVVPLHADGWGHLTEELDALEPAFARRGLGDRLLLITPGVETGITVPPTR